MLTRRHLRIRVLQILYAYYQNNCDNVILFERYLSNSLKIIYIQYYQLLLLLIDVINFNRNNDKKAMLITNDLQLLYMNYLFISLDNNVFLQNQIKKYNIKNDFDLISSLFDKMINSSEYKMYMQNDVPSDKKFIKLIFKHIFKPSILLNQLMYELNMNWYLDKNIIFSMIFNTIDNYSDSNKLLFNTNKLEYDIVFVKGLYNNTIHNNLLIENHIINIVHNWNYKRIALMDSIIIKMALTEIINYPLIPYKVSINEYIEIAKIFSGPNSNSFINGIINKIYVSFYKQN